MLVVMEMLEFLIDLSTWLSAAKFIMASGSNSFRRSSISGLFPIQPSINGNFQVSLFLQGFLVLA